MIPFLYCNLKDIVIKLLDIIVEHKIIGKCKNGKQLMEIDLAKEENLLSVNNIKIGFSVEDTINKLKQKDLVTITEFNAFKEGAQRLIIPMLAKLFEKSALGSTVLRSASIFDPTLMCDLPKKNCRKGGNNF